MKNKLRKRWLYVGSGLLLTLLLSFAYVGHHRFHMRTLYKTAFSYSDTLDAELAVEELSSYPSSYATELLLRIAVSPGGYYAAREIAVRELTKREDDRISSSLAALLHPLTDLYLRQAVSTALVQRECSYTCVQFILRHIRSEWRGVPHVEDVYKKTPEGKSKIEAEQRKVITNLISVLKNNKEDTLELLKYPHGLGGPQVQSFAIRVVEQIEAKEACPDLRLSEDQTQDESIRKAAQAVIERLGCQ